MKKIVIGDWLGLNVPFFYGPMPCFFPAPMLFAFLPFPNWIDSILLSFFAFVTNIVHTTQF